MRPSVGRIILAAVRYPMIDDARAALFSGHRFADLSAGDAMANPELPDGSVGVAKCVPIVGFRVRKERRIEIETHTAAFPPVHPVGKMPRLKRIAADKLAAGLGVA